MLHLIIADFKRHKAVKEGKKKNGQEMASTQQLLFLLLACCAYSATAAAPASVEEESAALVRHYRKANYTTEMILQDLMKTLETNTTKALEKQRSKRSTTCYASPAIYGGTGGGYFADQNSPCPSGVSRIEIYESGTVIRSLRAVYSDPYIEGARHGSASGTYHPIYLYNDEDIIAVVGMHGNHGGYHGRVFQLSFLTHRPNGQRRVWGPYGVQGGSLFIYHANVVSFRGRAGNDLDALGFFHT